MVKSAVSASGDAAPVVQVMVFAVDGLACALPIDQVERVTGMVAMAPLPGGGALARGVISVAGETVPVIDLRARLGRPERAPRPEDFLILARTRRRRLALQADEVSGVERLSFTPPADPILYGGKPIAGLALLGRSPVVIYDLDRFLTPTEEAVLHGATAA